MSYAARASKTVLVTGIGGNVGQGILRNIAALNLDIRIVGTDIATFTAGNHLCHATYQVPYAVDASYIPRINDIIIKEKVDLILPSTDYEVYILSKNQDIVKAFVLASDADIAEMYLDKYKSYIHHAQLGIPFAKSWLPIDYDNSEKEIIAKPREGRGSRGILINPENPQLLGDDYLIQPLLKGKEITTAVYVNRNGNFHGMITMERELTNGTTSKCQVVFDYDAQLKKMIDTMIAHGGLKGSFNIQSIVTETGDIVPFEVNCRISGTNSIRHNLGFQDVKYAIQEYLYHQNPDAVAVKKGFAVRILMDVIYPEGEEVMAGHNALSEHIVY
jgi:carbamoyl-phosphate synthase large subunit